MDLCFSPAESQPQRRNSLRQLRALIRAAVPVALALTSTAVRAGDEVRISGLSNAAFGTLTSLTTDAVRRQNVCLYSKSPPNNFYRITGTGSGAGGAFLLASGSATLPYEVQWADTSGQLTGQTLTANQPLTGQQSPFGAGDSDDCAGGTSATLIVVLRASALGAAAGGTYQGTLNLLVAPQ